MLSLSFFNMLTWSLDVAGLPGLTGDFRSSIVGQLSTGCQDGSSYFSSRRGGSEKAVVTKSSQRIQSVGAAEQAACVVTTGMLFLI